MNQNKFSDIELALSDEPEADTAAFTLTCECCCESEGTDYSCSNESNSSSHCGCTKGTARLLQFDRDGNASVNGCICCPDTHEAWYYFRAPETAEYAIFTNTGMFDPAGNCYDSIGQRGATDDNSGVGLNFCMFANLRQGGTYYICVKSQNNATGSFTLSVEKAVHATSVKLNQDALFLTPGETGYLYPEVLPSTAHAKDVSWSSSNPNVAPRDLFVGLVRAKNYGKTDFTATTVDRQHQAVCKVYVVPSPVPEGELLRVATANQKTLNMMAQADGNSILGQLSSGDYVILQNETRTNGKYLVYGVTNDGVARSGWCEGNHLEREVEYGRLISSDNWSVRKGAGVSYDKMGLLKSSQSVKILEKSTKEADGYMWLQIDFNGAVGYVVAYDNRNNKSKNFKFYTQWDPLIGEATPSVASNASHACEEFIKDYETFRNTAYDDGYGHLTIGYGHVISADENLVVITEQKAEELFNEDMQAAETLVNNTSNNREALWNQQEFDSFVSLAFNAGTDALISVMESIINGEEPRKSFLKIIHSNGQNSEGLYRRRMDEADIFIDGTYVREYPSLSS